MIGTSSRVPSGTSSVRISSSVSSVEYQQPLVPAVSSSTWPERQMGQHCACSTIRYLSTGHRIGSQPQIDVSTLILGTAQQPELGPAATAVRQRRYLDGGWLFEAFGTLHQLLVKGRISGTAHPRSVPDIVTCAV
eukprot:3295593-Rhodomonas_salina.3